ncbi:MAG: TonB-dependent receptor [Acidobacteria bacterium]|nr:TonB-dependent receptor [Acidobacteriota bacterium]
MSPHRMFLKLLCLVLGVSAQTGTGRISGLVKDSTGAVVPAVRVAALHEQTGLKHETTTTDSGGYVFPSLPVGPYSISVELQGFKKYTATGNVLTVGIDLDLDVVLQPGTLSETVTVSEAYSKVQTTESSLSTLIPEKTIVTLPLNGRNPLHLIALAPGVVGHSAEATSSGGTSTHYINGDRGRGITTTQDGIDISDPVIPRGELTNAPVNPEALQEFRVITSNAKSEYGRSAGGQVEMVTKSGTNEFHGSAYEFLRNTALDANSFFNNRQGLPREVLRRNQFGASIGGPIRRNKAFFFFNYEGMRRTQETSPSSFLVPTASLRSGNFRFVTQPCPGQSAARNLGACTDTGGNPLVPVSSYNFVGNDPRRLGLDPIIQNEMLKFLPLPNDFTRGDGLNYAGLRFNSPTLNPVDTITARVDHTFNDKHALFARYNLAWRSDLINDIINTTPRPMSWPARVRISDQQSAALGVKSSLGPHLLNEWTGGFTRNVLNFADPVNPRTYQICPGVGTGAPCLFASPFVYWGGTFRAPTEYQMLDNLSLIRGKHAFKGGVNLRAYRIPQYRGAGNPFGIYPTFTFNRLDASFSGLDAGAVARPDGSRVNLTGSGINSTDLNNLNTLYNVMLGRVGKIDQVFYSNGKAFPPGLNPLVLDQRLREYNFFFQDDWRISSKLTLNLGLRYELNSVPFDAGGVQVVNDKPLDGSQGPVTFLPAGPGTGRTWFNRDNNNFAPSIGLAYDPFGNGKTAIRGSYRLAYQRLISWALNVVEQRQPATSINQFLQGPRNSGLPAADNIVRLNELLRGGIIPDPQRGTSVSLNNGIPLLTPPTAINRTPGPNRGEQPLLFSPSMPTPYVQQWTLGIQREILSNTVFDMAYVGSRGVKLFRMNNVNQMDLRANGFIRDFLAAQRNLAANGNPNIGDPTGAFGRLYGGTIPAAAYADIRNSNIGAVADSLDRGVQGIGLSRAGLPDNFFRPNPQFTIAGLGCSCSNSWYNALQAQVQRRFSQGLTVNANYTFSKSIDDLSADTRGAGTEILVASDPRNRNLDRGRSDFDVNHVFRANFIYDLPLGRGKALLRDAPAPLNQILGGWQLNGIFDISSGFPFSVFSGYQTFTFYDSGTRVGSESASATSTRAVFTGSSAKIGSAARTGRDVQFFSAEEKALFRTAGVGELGAGRNIFTGPGFFQFDLGLFKNFTIREQRRLELRAEFFNLFNNVDFSNPTLVVTSGSFGNVGDTRVPPRIIQMALKFYF